MACSHLASCHAVVYFVPSSNVFVERYFCKFLGGDELPSPQLQSGLGDLSCLSCCYLWRTPRCASHSRATATRSSKTPRRRAGSTSRWWLASSPNAPTKGPDGDDVVVFRPLCRPPTPLTCSFSEPSWGLRSMSERWFVAHTGIGPQWVRI